MKKNWHNNLILNFIIYPEEKEKYNFMIKNFLNTLSAILPKFISWCNIKRLICIALLSISKITVELTAIGRKNFNIAAAYACNELPRNIRLAPSTAAFKRLLKTHLFWYVWFCIHVSLLCFVYDFVSAVVLTWIAHLNALLLLLLFYSTDIASHDMWHTLFWFARGCLHLCQFFNIIIV